MLRSRRLQAVFGLFCGLVLFLASSTQASHPVIDLCQTWNQTLCYRTNEQIPLYLQILVDKCPNLFSFESIGKSVLGRDLYVTRVRSYVSDGSMLRA